MVYVEIDEGEGLRPLELPEGLESVITLNIGSFSSGLDIWGQGREAGPVVVPPTVSPVRVEVEAASPGESQGRISNEAAQSEIPREDMRNTASTAHQGQVPGSIGVRATEFRAPSVSDGFLELVGINHVSHLGLSHAGCHTCMPLDRVAQAQALRFKVVQPVHMQLDGEAWMQEASERQPCLITVTRGESVQIIANVGFVPPSTCCAPGVCG